MLAKRRASVADRGPTLGQHPATPCARWVVTSNIKRSA